MKVFGIIFEDYFKFSRQNIESFYARFFPVRKAEDF